MLEIWVLDEYSDVLYIQGFNIWHYAILRGQPPCAARHAHSFVLPMTIIPRPRINSASSNNLEAAATTRFRPPPPDNHSDSRDSSLVTPSFLCIRKRCQSQYSLF